MIVTRLNGLTSPPLAPQQVTDRDNLVNKINEILQTVVNTLFPINIPITLETVMSVFWLTALVNAISESSK